MQNFTQTTDQLQFTSKKIRKVIKKQEKNRQTIEKVKNLPKSEALKTLLQETDGESKESFYFFIHFIISREDKCKNIF